MKIKLKLKHFPFTITVVALGASPLAATAQQEVAATRLEEIVVTAQRREERLQDVPIAVSALSGRELELRGIDGISGLATGEIPSLNAQNFAGRPGAMQMSIRGVGISDAAQISFEQAVAVYADGVYLARAQGMGLDMLELERVEVLRGPQGTLFGRNAVGGAINIVPRKPGGEFRVRQRIEYGRFDSWKSVTTLETEEWNNLSFKLDYAARDTDGWQSNPAGEDFNLHDETGWRVAARWQPSDTFTADYSYDETRLKYTQGYNHLVINSTVPIFAGLMAPYVHDSRLGAAPAPGLPSPFGISSNDVLGHTLTMEWHLSDSQTFKSITAYRENEVRQGGSIGFGVLSPSPDNTGFLSSSGSFELMGQKQFSQEFQLFGSTDRFEYTLGAMYFEEEASNTNWSDFTLFIPFGHTTPQILDPAFVGPRTTTSVDTKSLGVYGQMTWTPPVLDDRLHITGGLRYSKDEKELFRSLLQGNPVAVPVTADEERIDPAVTLAYDVTGDINVYGRWAIAYRAGGASVRELPVAGDLSDSGFHAFSPEEVELWELGLKSELFDRRVRFNAALFHQEYTDKQVSFQKDSVSNTRVFNIDKPVRITGADVELTWMATDSLILNFAGTWLNDNIRTVRNVNTGVEERFYLAQTPNFRWAASSDYVFPVQPMGGELNLFVSLTGSSDYCFNERSCFERFESIRGGSGKTGGDDNTLLNARLNLSDIVFANGRLSCALWGENLTDQEYYTFGFSVPGLDTASVLYGQPRTYGVSVIYEY